jgi:RNA polymerase sigma-70 factor (ECF subfamily)
MLQTLSSTQTETVKNITVPAVHISDEELIQRIKDGETDAYGGIMRRYNQRIYRIARSIVTDDAAAMDIVQEAHIKAYTKINDFRGETRFFAWLAAITRNEALMYVRKYKREVSMQDDEIQFFEQSHKESHPAEPEALPDTLLENKQIQSLIDKNIDKLPENFRTVFILRAVEQFSVKETAQILDIKEETVKTRFFRAKRLLKEQIQIYLDNAGMKIYEFGGDHCDIIVHNVMEKIKNRN